MRNPITLTSDLGEVCEFFPEDMLLLKYDGTGVVTITLRCNITITFTRSQPKVWEELQKAFRMRGE